MDIVTRLKLFMDYTKLPSSQFADLAQIPRPTLSQIMNGRNKKISNELITKLHEAFPQLNVLWLMFGDGDMVFDENIEFSEALNEPNLFNAKEQPALDQDITNIDNTENNNSISTSSTSPTIKRTDADEAFMNTNQKSDPQQEEIGSNIKQTLIADKTKKIASIMVFYTDNSFENFIPS
jgi:transcriptional regulator with XRE-family HTH domain